MVGLPNKQTGFSAVHVEQTPNPGSTTNGDAASGENGQQTIFTDVLIVGGGFGGMYGLHRMRQLGLTVKLFEAGADFGGTWFWNRYPGARVDSETPFYSLSIPEVYNDWYFTERYPGHQELRDYFKHVDDVLDLRKDAYFNTVVVEARYHPEEAKWHVRTRDGQQAKAAYLICATGSSYKKHFPQFEGLSNYTGQLIHSAAYPEAGIDVKGKRVGVLGSGATGVQIVQELAKENCALTAFIRTPNVAIPMRQRKLTHEEQLATKNIYQALYNSAKRCSTGFPYAQTSKRFHEASPEERREFYEMLWKRGGFSFLLCNYRDFFADRTANREIYEFWAEKTRARIQDPFKRDVVVPLKQPHWLGTKRASLEQDYFEMIDRPNVTAVDLKQTPIVRFEQHGIRTSEKLLEFDVIIFATGYDALTGSLKDMGLVDTDGVALSKKWEKGTYTYMGLTIPKLPNLFMVYSPQAPTSLANGPAIIENQIDWIAEAVCKMREQGIEYIDAKQSSAEEWRAAVQGISDMTLFKGTKSWYTG
jgi:cation diffusion facilitator CzcD-associated flavoprotein CzcO